MRVSRPDIIFGAIAAAFLLLVLRLALVQLLVGERFADRYRGSTLVEESLETRRGGIYARDGTALAVDTPYFRVCVNYSDLLFTQVVATGQWQPRLSEVRYHRDVNPDSPDTSSCYACHRPGGATYRSRRKLREFKGRCLECHPPQTAWNSVLSSLLGVPRQELNARASERVKRVERVWESVHKRTSLPNLRIVEQEQAYPVADHIEFDKLASLEEGLARMPGVLVEVSSERVYSDGWLAPHVVGFLGAVKSPDRLPAEPAEFADWLSEHEGAGLDKSYQPGDKEGVRGIEAHYEALLRGARGVVKQEKSLVTMRVERKLAETPPSAGFDVWLTIDPVVQAAAVQALREAANGQWNVERGAVIVMRCNGEVLAMASAPSFDLATLRTDYDKLVSDKLAPLLNRCVQASLPAGSVFKPVVAVAGLESGTISANTVFHCSGRKQVQGSVLRCNARWGHGPQNVVQAIENSCNVFFFETAEHIHRQRGYECLTQYARRFGFGTPTGIDLPADKPGRMPVPKSQLELMNMAIGQGRVEVTPLQVACMTAAVANGGTVPVPHLLLRVTSRDRQRSRDYGSSVAPMRLGVSPATFAPLREGMRRVPITGTARNTDLARFHVAAKTGTADISRGGEINHAWVTGYFPYESPQYVITILAERVRGHGGEVAGPIAQSVLEKAEKRLRELSL